MSLRAVIALGFALVLGSCNQGSSDGYTFEPGTQRLSPQREIRVVTYQTMNALKEAYAGTHGARQLGTTEELQAFSVINSSTCTIHMIDPAVRYMPEFFGHELVHCLYGEFHPHQNGAA